MEVCPSRTAGTAAQQWSTVQADPEHAVFRLGNFLAGFIVLRWIVASYLIAIAACATSAVRADETQPAVYQRVSTQATIARAIWAQRGGQWGGGNWGWGYPGFYNPWIAPQTFGGTWYQRPYPDHLIYNNVRSGMPLAPAACCLGEPDASASGFYNAELQGTNVPRSP